MTSSLVFKDREFKIEEEKTKYIRQNAIEQQTKSQRQIAALTSELEAFKKKVVSLQQKKSVDINQQFCCLCKQEFIEKQNFNWSCCTHRSEWGGTMWWCCGKTNQNAKGCKYQKHVCKQTQDEREDHKGQDESKQKCSVCKQAGHGAFECELDPNLRTSYNVITETVRIDKIKAIKKRFQDANDLTKHLLETEALKNISNEKGIGRLMMQDDFNYSAYNQTIFNLDIPVAGNESSELASQTSHESRSNKSEDRMSDGSEQIKIQKQREDLKLFKQSFKSKDTTIKLISEEQKHLFERAQEVDPFCGLITDRLLLSVHKEETLHKLEDEIQKLIDSSQKSKKPRRVRRQRRSVTN